MGSAEAGSPRCPPSGTWAWDTCLVSTGRDGGPRSLDATQPLRLHKLQSVGKGQPRASSASQPRHSKADQEKGCVCYYSKWNRGHFEEDPSSISSFPPLFNVSFHCFTQIPLSPLSDPLSPAEEYVLEIYLISLALLSDLLELFWLVKSTMCCRFSWRPRETEQDQRKHFYIIYN